MELECRKGGLGNVGCAGERVEECGRRKSEWRKEMKSVLGEWQKWKEGSECRCGWRMPGVEDGGSGSGEMRDGEGGSGGV